MGNKLFPVAEDIKIKKSKLSATLEELCVVVWMLLISHTHR
jgi:hypothetical protein